MKVITTIVFFLGMLLSMPFSSFSQAGGLDSTFQGDGIRLYAPGDEHDNCYKMKILPDGKILTCGVTKTNGTGGPYSGMLMRVLDNGNPDLTWGTGGVVSWQWGIDTYANDMIIQPDGKILVSGIVSITVVNHDIYVARFNADGTPDLSFNTTGHVILPYSTGDEDCKAMALQPDGKIVLAGNTGAGPSNFLFTRVNVDGALDLTFGLSGYREINAYNLSQLIETIGILSNGTIVGMGYAEKAAPLFGLQAVMVKLTPGGNPVPGFGSGGVLTPAVFSDISNVNQMIIAGDQIYATGYMYNSSNLHQLFLAKLDSAGVAIPSFGNGGIHCTVINPVNSGLDVRIFGDGKIYVCGLSGQGTMMNKDIIVLRYTANGQPDPLWNGTGYVVTPVRQDADTGEAIDMQIDGKIVVAGNSSGMTSGGDNDVVIARYNNDYITLYANFIANDSTLCNGGTVSFTNLSSPTATSYFWTFQGATPATSVAASPTVTYGSLGEFDVTLQVTRGSQTATLVKSQYIRNYVTPATPVAPTGNTTFCQTTNQNFSVTPVTWATAYIWEVNPATAGTFSGSGSTVTFLPSQTWSGSFTVRVKAQNFCGTSTLSPPLVCTMNPSPTQFYLNGDGNYCQGEPGAGLTLSGSQTGVSYQLYIDGIPGGPVVTGTGSPLNFGFQTTNGNYTCQGTTSLCSNSMWGSIQVQMLLLPGTAGTPIGPVSACNNSNDTYTTTSTQADTIQWTLTPAGAGTLAPTVPGTIGITWSPSFSGNVQLTAQGQNQCGSGPVSPALSIFVSDAPDSQISGQSLVCKNSQNVYSTTDHPGNNYHWTVSGGAVVSGSGTSQITVLWGLPGTGTVVLTETTPDSCVTMTLPFQVTIDECTGTNDMAAPALRLFPNPSGDHFHLNGKDLNLVRMVSVLTVTGLCLKTVSFDLPVSGPAATVPLDGLTPGVYLVMVLMNDGQLHFYRLIRQLQ